MLEITNEIINGIKEGDEDSFLYAEEVAMFLAFGLGESGIVDPIYSEMKINPASKEDGDALQSALVDHIRAKGVEASPSAVWALGKFQNADNIDVLRKQLSLQVSRFLRHNKALYNTLDALQKCGETAFTSGSFGVINVEDNLEDARKYLSNFGENYPW